MMGAYYGMPYDTLVNSLVLAESSVALRVNGPRPTRPAHAKAISKFTSEERSRLMAANGCYRCRKENAGHVAAECPGLSPGRQTKLAPRLATINHVAADSTNNSSTCIVPTSSTSKDPIKTPKLRVTAAKVPTMALIDTCAEVNIISEHLANRTPHA